MQTTYNVETFERAINRRITNRDVLIRHLHRVAVWAFIGCGLVHPRFRDTARSISPAFEQRIDAATRRQFGPQIQRLEAARGPARRARSQRQATAAVEK
jgi:hypothetical protein